MPVDHHPYHEGQFNRPPQGERWGWQDHERFNKGWDPFFFKQSPNYDRWHEHISTEALVIGGLLNVCNTIEANRLLNAELYDLRCDRYAQNQLLREIADARGTGNCAYVNLGNWSPDTGTWGTIEVVPPPPQPDPDTGEVPPVTPPTPVPTFDNDPWMQLEGTVISALLDAGDSQAAAARLNSDLYSLRGNLDAQDALLGLVDSSDLKGTRSDLKLGNWNQDAGQYDSIEVLPAGTDPGNGISISEYSAADAAPPDGVIDTTKSNAATDPWQHQEIAIVAALLDAGDASSAATRLSSDLQALAGNLDAQNAVLSQIALSHSTGTGADLKLGDWDATTGTYSSIEVLPVGNDPGTGTRINVFADAPPSDSTPTDVPPPTSPAPDLPNPPDVPFPPPDLPLPPPDVPSPTPPAPDLPNPPDVPFPPPDPGSPVLDLPLPPLPDPGVPFTSDSGN